MLLLPLPIMIIEFLVFFFAIKHWGFFNTVGFYLLPCLLGFFIVSTVGRMGLLTLQSTVMKGKLPATQILHSIAIFISGLLFLIPTFSTRVLALFLFLPGFRHLLVWRFKLSMAKKMASGINGFSGGFGNFKFYGFGGMPPQNSEGTRAEYSRAERDVGPAVLDVTPLKVTHEKNENDPESKD